MEVTRLGAKAGRALTTSGLGDPPAHDPPRLESATALPIWAWVQTGREGGSPDGRTSRSSAEPRAPSPSRQPRRLLSDREEILASRTRLASGPVRWMHQQHAGSITERADEQQCLNERLNEVQQRARAIAHCAEEFQQPELSRPYDEPTHL